MDRKSLLFAFLILFSGVVAGISIGTAPGSLDLGTVSPGSTVEQNIYIRASDVGQNFTIRPSANGVNPASLFSGGIENKNEISEQDGVEWWNFEETTIDPSTDLPPNEIEDSNVPTVQGVTQFTLQVPSDAEPGFRYGNIRLNADLGSANGTGSGARIVTPTRLTYSYRVPGRVERNIIVSDVRAFRLGEDQAAVELLLSNEGTVTTTADNFRVDVLDSSRSRETTLTVNGITLEPGEERWVDASWSSGNGIEEGAYRIDGRVDYLTGMATATGSFSLPGFDVVEVRPPDSPANEGQERSSVPLWLIVMVLILMGVLMWSFGIDPFWILLIVGVLGISAFILMSGISNYLLILLLMVVAIVVYGGL